MDALARVSRHSGALIAVVAVALAALGMNAGRRQARALPFQAESAAQTQTFVTFRQGTSPTAHADAVVPADAVVHAALMPNDTLFGQLLWPAKSANLPAAWDMTRGDPSITIAVVDTGVSAVPDLAGALVPGYDFVNRDTDASDDNGHGTIVASIAAARIDNGIGIAGVCGRCSIMPIKVLDADGSGLSSTTAKGIGWAAAHGARIINLSASVLTEDPVLDAAIASVVAGGAVVVLAAGNGGSSDPGRGGEAAHAGYPAATSPAAIRVAAVDANGALYPWSNHGAWVDVAAPGRVAIAEADGGAYVYEEGTSVAAPIVAGIAGLLLSRFPDLSPYDVKSLISSNGTAASGLDVASGRRVDAHASLILADYLRSAARRKTMTRRLPARASVTATAARAR